VNDDTNFEPVEPVEPVEMTPTRAELIASVRARGRQIRARRRVAITGLTALLVLAVAAPAIAIGTRSSSHTVPPATDIRPAPVVKPHSALSTSIELPGKTFVAGSDVHATLVIDNTTDKTVTLEPPGTCREKWAVSLTNATVPLTLTFTTECGLQRTRLLPGANRFPVIVLTTYTGCVRQGAVGTAITVRCLPDGSLPPLPSGQYQVVLSTFPAGRLPAPAALTVHVTAPGSAKP
jgi:hypothetical protein